MDVSRVQSLVEQLEDNIDDLEENLEPVLSQALSESTKRLPLLDKAKLHIVIVYAIESLLFSYLKLHDVDAKEHPIFRELTRVKQYFEKVKVVEDGPVQPRENMSLNKQAAARIIKHSLAGNDKLDLARLEQEARQKLLAKRKLKDLETSMKEKAQLSDQGPQSVEEQLVDQIAVELEKQEDAEVVASVPAVDEQQEAKSSKKDKKRKRKDEKSEAKNKTADASKGTKTSRTARKKARKEAKAAAQISG